jgi:zinc-ribbon domain
MPALPSSRFRFHAIRCSAPLSSVHMAMKPCKECGHEISTEATTCPHCGKKNPTGVRTSPVALGCLALIGFVIVVGVFSSSNSSTTSSSSTNSAPSVKEQVLDQVKLNFTWSKSEFGIMTANFTVRNPTQYRIKDLEITCTHYGPSGTRIDENVRKIYEVVSPKSTRHFNDFNMGFIHSQATSSNCRVTDLVIQ